MSTCIAKPRDEATLSMPESSGPVTRRRLIRAGSWVGAGQLLGNALRLGSSLVMTRLLAPEAFGLFAIVTVVSVVLALLADVGIRSAIITNARGTSVDFLDTAWTVQIVRGVLVSAATLIVGVALSVAGRLGWFAPGTTFGDPLLPWLIAASAASPVILGLQSTKLFLLERAFNMKAVSAVQLATQAFGVVVTVSVALIERSVWAIVVGMICGNVAHVLLTHFALPGTRNRLRWDRDVLRELLVFGRWVLLSSAISVFALNGDRLVLGGLISADQLGIYSIAMSITSLALAFVMAVGSALALPTLGDAARRNENQLRKSFATMRRWMDRILVCSAGVLFATAAPIIHFLYDERYSQAGEMLAALSFGLAFSRVMLPQQVYMVLGRSKYLAIISGVSVATLYVSLPASYFAGGLLAATYAIALREVPAYLTVLVLNARHKLNDFRHELTVLAMWPIGWAAGSVVLKLMGLVRG